MQHQLGKILVLTALTLVSTQAIANGACDSIQSANLQLKTEDCEFLNVLADIQPSLYEAYVDTQLQADNTDPLSIVDFITLVTRSNNSFEANEQESLVFAED